MRVHHTIVLAISMHGDDYTVLQVGDNEDVSNNDRGTVVVVRALKQLIDLQLIAINCQLIDLQLK